METAARKYELKSEIVEQSPEVIEVSAVQELIKGTGALFTEVQKMTKQTTIIVGTKLSGVSF